MEAYFVENFPDLTWIFSGIGTTISASLASAIFGGLVGYKIGINQKIRQTQTAGKKANQYQETKLMAHKVDSNETIVTNLMQTQKAGDNSQQIQIVGTKNDE